MNVVNTKDMTEVDRDLESIFTKSDIFTNYISSEIVPDNLEGQEDFEERAKILSDKIVSPKVSSEDFFTIANLESDFSTDQMRKLISIAEYSSPIKSVALDYLGDIYADDLKDVHFLDAVIEIVNRKKDQNRIYGYYNRDKNSTVLVFE